MGQAGSGHGACVDVVGDESVEHCSVLALGGGVVGQRRGGTGDGGVFLGDMGCGGF